MQKIIFYIKTISLTLLLYLAVLLAGVLYLPELQSIWWGFLPVAVLLLLLAISVLTIRQTALRMDFQQADALLAEVEKEKEEARAHYERYQKRFASVITRTWLWAGLCLLCALLFLLIGVGLWNTHDLLASGLNLAGLYLLYSMVHWMIPQSEKLPDEAVMEKKEYPALYQLAEEVFPGKTRLLYSSENTIGITMEEKEARIILGIYDLMILSREELKQVFLHEKGHMQTIAKDPQVRATNLMIRHRTPTSNWNFLAQGLMRGQEFLLMILLQKTQAYTSLIKEEQADEYVKSCGDPSTYSAALAKVGMMSYFMAFEEESKVRFYQGEEPVKNAFSCDYQAFLNCVRQKQDFWMEMLKKELPSYISSHPAFSQRWEAVGKPDFALAFSNLLEKQENAYEQDVVKMLEHMNQDAYQTNLKTQKEAHQELWVKPMEIIGEYERERAAGKAYTTLELRKVLDAYHTVADYKKLEECCRYALTLSDAEHELAHAHFLLGKCLLLKYEEEGIDYIYKALDNNHNYREEGFDMVGSFCLSMGLRDRLEEYRAKHKNDIQEDMDTDYTSIDSLSKGDNISIETELPKEQQEKNAKVIREICGDHLAHLYQIRKETKGGFFATLYVLQFVMDTPDEIIEICMDRIFEYLDNEEWQYGLFTRDGIHGFKQKDLEPYEMTSN